MRIFKVTIPPLLKMNTICPICFEDLVKKNRSTPDICGHVFCSPCLEKWSKHGSYCPVDRKRFRKIMNLDSETVIQIKPCRPKQTRVLYDVTTYCEVCKKANNASTLLLCDCCDLGYHCKCLQPPLQEVPPGVWYCPVCVAVDTKIKKSKDPKSVRKLNEAQSNRGDLPSESSQDISPPQSHANHFKSEGTATTQEKSRVNRTESASLLKSSPRSYSNDEAICADNFLVSETEVDKSLKINNMSATSSNVKGPLTTQINIKREVKNISRENISSWSRRLRNRGRGSKSNETVAYSSVTEQSDNKQEQHYENEVKTTSLVKDEQTNVCPLSRLSDFENNSIEGIYNFKTESKSSLSIKLRNKGNRFITNRGKSYSCKSLEAIKQNKSSSCPSEEDSLRIQSNSAFNEVKQNHEILTKSNNMSNSCGLSISHANKGFQLNVPDSSNSNTVPLIQNYSKKCSKNTPISSKYDSEFSKNPLKATRGSVRNMHDENQDNVCVLSVIPEIGQKKMLRNLKVRIKDSEGSMNLNTGIINPPDIDTSTQRNINKDIAPKLEMKIKQTINKNYVQPNTEEELNKNCQNTDLELHSRKVNSAKIETNFENTKWCIHYCQNPGNLKKGNNLKSEKLGSKEKKFLTSQANVARNKSIIPGSAEELQKNNAIVTSQNKKEYCRNVRSMFIDVKNDGPFVDSSISISDTPVYKVSEKSKRIDTSLSFDNSNLPLTKESEKHQLNTNGCFSMDETGVLIHPESSESAKYYFLTRKSISNFAMEKLSLLSSEKNEKQDHKWYHYEEEDPSISNSKVLNNSIQSTAVTALSSTPGKYEEPSNLKKPKHGSYHIEELDPAIFNKKVLDRSIQSTAVTSLLATTKKYEEPSSKKKTGHGWYPMEEHDPALCNSGIPEMNIRSTVFTALSATSEEISKDETGQSLCHKEKEDPAIHNVSEKSIYSTISAASRKYKEPIKNKTGQGWYHNEDQEPAIANRKISENSIPSTMCTMLSATSKKCNERIKKTGQGWYRYEDQEPAIANRKISKNSIQSTMLSATSKKSNECIKKTGQGWYRYEDQEPGISNSEISAKSIQSKIVSEENEAGSQKPILCASLTKVKTCTLKNAQYTSDNISSLNQDPITTSPKFSVFESVDHTCISRQKYLSLNKSVMDTSLGSKNTLSLFANASVNSLKDDQSDLTPCEVQNASLAMNPSKSYRSREVYYAIKAKMNLANELLKIEREKWPQHLKKYKKRRSSCSKYSKKGDRDTCESELKRSNVT